MHAHTSIKMCSCINRQLHLQICQGDTFCGWLNCPIGSLPTLRVRPSRSGSLTLAVFVQFQHRFGMGTRHSQPTVCNEAVGCRWDVQPDQLDVPACPDQTLSPLWHNNEHAARTLQPHSMRPAAAGRSTCKCACVCVCVNTYRCARRQGIANLPPTYPLDYLLAASSACLSTCGAKAAGKKKG